MPKTTVLLITVIAVSGLASCGESPRNEKETPNTQQNLRAGIQVADSSNASFNGHDDSENATTFAGCKGNACKFVRLKATTNSENIITSITIRNLKSEALKIQIEFTNILGYSPPWTKLTLAGDESETQKVDASFKFIGAEIKRANVIE